MSNIYGMARNTDPDTSHEAATSFEASKLISRIYSAMEKYGNWGCTGDDIENDLSDIQSSSITPRFKQMIERGMIEYSGEKRKGNSGRMQLVRRYLPKPFQAKLKTASKAAVLQDRIDMVKGLKQYRGRNNTLWLKYNDVMEVIK